jgi:hypothetical protein
MTAPSAQAQPARTRSASASISFLLLTTQSWLGARTRAASQWSIDGPAPSNTQRVWTRAAAARSTAA